MEESNIRTFLNKHIYRYIREIDLKQSQFVAIPAVLFSLFMVFGKSFEETNTWSLVFGSGSAVLIKACVKFAILFVLFYYIICFIYFRLNIIYVGKPSSDTVSQRKYRIPIYGKYVNCLSRFPFRTAFLTLLIVYIPYIIVSYPAIIIGDTSFQIVQAYPQLGIIKPDYLEGHLLSEQVYLNNHHPITHTLLIHLCMQIGAGIFHSFNVGIFIAGMLQFLFLLSAVSYGIKILVEKTAMPNRYIPLIILYYIISPRIQNYMFFVTKDVIYAAFLLYFLLFFYLLITKPERRYYVLFALSGLGMILFRNEGRFILMISLPILALLYKKMWKFFMKYWIAVIGFSILFFHFVLPICNVTPGSTKEMLSVPFQQTARYVANYEEEVTDEEREAIDAVLDYSNLSYFYFPDRSDSVKDTYKEDCTREDLLRYFKVWFQMFFKHPGTYIQAFINNYYYYFYGGLISFYQCDYQISSMWMQQLNEYMEPLGADFHYPAQFDYARSIYSKIRDGYLAYVPPVTFLMFSVTYTWSLIILLFYGIYKKISQALSMLVVPAVLVCMCLLGPCNAFYGRYIYPILIVFPFLILQYFSKLYHKGRV